MSEEKAMQFGDIHENLKKQMEVKEEESPYVKERIKKLEENENALEKSWRVS